MATLKYYNGSEWEIISQVKMGGDSAYYEGTVTSDSNGYLTLPQLDFTPKTIVVYKFVKYEPGNKLDDYTAYDGILLTFIYDTSYNSWISTWLHRDSGQMAIVNVTADALVKNPVSIINNCYKLYLGPGTEDDQHDTTGIAFNVRAYG